MANLRLSWISSFSIAEANLSDGLRAASSSAAMLLAGHYFHNPMFAWAAIGAFWTCLADAAGTPTRRLASMVGFSLLSILAGGMACLASAIGTVPAAATLLLCIFSAGISTVYSAAAYQVAILVATACVVMVDHPLHDVEDGLRFLGIYFTGCAFATFLSFTVWALDPFFSARSAVKLLYACLAELSRDSARLVLTDKASANEWARHAADSRSVLRDSIESSRQLLALLPQTNCTRRTIYHELSSAVEDADVIFGYLLATSHAAEQLPKGDHSRRRSARALTVMAEILMRIGGAVANSEATYPVELRGRLTRISRHIKNVVSSDLPPHSPVSREISPPAAVNRSFMAAGIAVIRSSFDTLRENLTTRSTGYRHAARLAVATTFSFVIVRKFHLQSGYWATMTTLLVMRPSIGSTWPRGIERAAGSSIGTVLAIVIGSIARSSLALTLAVFPLAFLAMVVRRVNYGLFAIFLTPTFVLVADFASPADEFIYSVDRLGNNVLGICVAIIGTYLLWPKRDRDELNRLMTNAVMANMDYLSRALQSSKFSQEECELARRNAGLSSNELERTVKLARLEWWKITDTDRDIVKVAEILRGVAGWAAHFRFSGQSCPSSVALLTCLVDLSSAMRSVGVSNTVVSRPCLQASLASESLTVLDRNLLREIAALTCLLEKISRVGISPGNVEHRIV